MPNTKYNEEVISIVEANIANGESIAYSTFQAGIGRETYRTWYNSKPEFKERMDAAKERYKIACPPELRRHAKQKIKDLIEIGHIITSEETTIIEKPILNRNGAITGWEIKERITKKTETNMGTPQHAFDRILPLEPTLEIAFEIIKAHGYSITIDPDHLSEHQEFLQLQNSAQSLSDGQKALTEQDYNTIRARILGISEDATDSPGLSTEVGK